MISVIVSPKYQVVIPKEVREYLRAIAIAFDKDLVDMPTYLKTANAMGQQIEEYIESMPLSREDFRKYSRSLYQETYKWPCLIFKCYYPSVLLS